MTDEPAAETERTTATEPLDEVLTGVLDDIDAAYGDYERGYADADATLSVVMSHVDRLRDGVDDE